MNNSFIGTPSMKSFDEPENNKNLLNEAPIDVAEAKKKDSASRQLNFPTASTANTAKEQPILSIFSKIQHTKPTNSTCTVPKKSNSFEEKLTEAFTNEATAEATAIKRTTSAPIKSNSFEDKVICEGINVELSTPKVTSKSDESSGRGTAHFDTVESVSKAISQLDLKDETPYKTFQMPSARRLQSSTRLLTSNATKKCRSTIESEFRSQKVLFTTPSAVPRPTIKMINTVGLDDSLNCYKSSPLVHLSPVKEERAIASKAKVQLKMTTTSMPPPRTTNESIEAHEPKPIAQTESETQDVDGEKKKIIQINGKDFIIHKRIGQGGSSSVFLAEHKGSKTECALKVGRKIQMKQEFILMMKIWRLLDFLGG